MNRTRLGVFGGTFDPIHIGHLVAAEAARDAFQLDRVLFVPAARPPHKLGQVRATPEQRLQMTILATADNPAFAVSRLEIDRPGPSYTIDTLRDLAAENAGCHLHFITGADAVLELASWREPEALLDVAEFIAVARPGAAAERVAAFAATLGRRGARIRYLAIPAIDISSHELRSRVRAGQSIRYLVPAEVAEYILREGLYVSGE